jgi:hypothetical protein
VAYSTVQDLMFGSVPLPVDPERWITAADEEIDASIGRLYVTPISFPGSTEARPAKLLIKKTSAMLATGRAIMAIDAGSQENNLHQYAAYLVREACKTIAAIASGEITLDAVQMTNPEDTSSAPKIYNLDASSAVEDFFGNFQAPVFSDADRPYWSYPYRGQ